jgi:hypothetical protein
MSTRDAIRREWSRHARLLGQHLQPNDGILGELGENCAITGGETPASEPRVGNDETVEGIVCPTQIDGRIEEIEGHGVVDGPAGIVAEGATGAGGKSNALGLFQKCQFEQADGRNVKAARACECPTARVSRVHPNKGVGVEEDHPVVVRLKDKPAVPDRQVQFPSATAGSRISMTELALRSALRFSSKTRRKRNWPRSITTDWPPAA